MAIELRQLGNTNWENLALDRAKMLMEELRSFNPNEPEIHIKQTELNTSSNSNKKHPQKYKTEILLITGKGLHSNVDQNTYASKDLSKLRYSVPEYIKSQKELSDKIIDIEHAEIKDGGDGAMILRLKKS